MLTLTDLFCGAGGSSTGAEQVPGVEVVMAVNHWRLAVATHAANHPGTAHDCADISQVDPRRYPSTDLLWASPECTNHSIARGVSRRRQAEARRTDLLGLLETAGPGGDAATRSRATMWDVVRFAEHHAYRAIVVENVVEAASWVLFPAWRSALMALGYETRLICLNSMHAASGGLPAPQSRDRLYVVAWRRGDTAPDLEPVIRPWAWCETHGWVQALQAFKNPARRVGRYRAQYANRCPQTSCRNRVVEPPTLPAASIIDWTDPGTRIGDRERPLAPRTLDRIRAGIRRYWGGDWEPLSPAGQGAGRAPSAAAEVLRARADSAPPSAVQPFIAELRGGGSDARPVTDPLATVTASGNHHALVTPRRGAAPDGAPAGLLMRNNSARGGRAHLTTPASEPARTITAAGRQSLLTGRTTDLDDVRFRMLAPDEIIRAMAFPGDYVVLGNRRERVRQAGNAVTPPAARDIVAALAGALAP